MKRLITAGVGLLTLCGTANAQIPVTDVVGDTNNMINFGESIANQVAAYGVQLKQQITETEELVADQFGWATQAASYARQGQQYLAEAQQLAALVHEPIQYAAMGLMNMTGLGSSMPISPGALMGAVNGVSYGGGGLMQINGMLGSVSTMSSGIYSQHNIYTPDDGRWDSQQMIINANSIAGTQALAGSAYGDLTNHSTAYQSMRDHLSTSDTPKDVQDAQAEIALEGVWTANQAAKLTATQITYEAQQASMKQQESEKTTQSFDDQLKQAIAAGVFE